MGKLHPNMEGHAVQHHVWNHMQILVTYFYLLVTYFQSNYSFGHLTPCE